MLKRSKFGKSLSMLLVLSTLLVQGSFTAKVFAATTTYEAETATLSGGTTTASDHTGYTGTSFVGGFTDVNKGTASVQFSVNVSTEASYTSTLKYSNGNADTRSLSIYVNGIKIKQTSLTSTTNWNTWGTVTETLTLNSGTNTITYKYDSSDSGNVNIDNIVVNSSDSSSTSLGTNLALGKTSLQIIPILDSLQLMLMMETFHLIMRDLLMLTLTL